MFDRLRSRIAPALLTAAGIALVTAGLLTYTAPSGADAQPSDPIVFATPTPPTASPSLITFPPVPSGSATPSVGPSPTPVNRVSTRVVVPALDIDLPVVKPPAGFPYCNVAMYLGDLLPARPARRDVPLRPRPDGHVPAAPDPQGE